MRDEPTLIDLIRHGEPSGGPMFRGSKDDPLSDTGWQQMRSAVSADDRWDVIVTSPLRRCRGFAEWLGAERGIKVDVIDQLREISFGDWEGRTAADIEAAYGDHLQRFWADPVANTPAGGEVITAFSERVLAGWAQLQASYAGQRVLLVCHGGVIRMILASVLGIPLSQSFSGFAVPFACRSRIRVDETAYGEFSALLSHTPLTTEPHLL
ncbi:histidine phosphatase family protein [Marinobacter halodurans]|uniref:Histidine phosphatase family protein n=1 Tax=Marinobacter halodurans TaxID=2528979 RepID=A0ABY1ZG14_9GAMM|nr:alpha-ribazole phosphatase family protein [Marinobacter halodurans]TBW50374.1 histidine phosphatase family protein [Marinobacter halodurans]